jgi:1-deoxy-D-xylulose-5-phosphate synthase
VTATTNPPLTNDPGMMQPPYLPKIKGPGDIKKMTVDQLNELAAEMRHSICEQVSKSGGHLAPNLGVVELSIALHYVFDFAHDRLLFDVGHQCYPHKLLTGRAGLLPKLRQRDGMAGFPEPRESPYDLFSVGHAGTAISTAVGMARGDTVNGQGDRRVVSIIGDASIVNGVALEGLNNAGTLGRQFLVILNDNGMSIAKPQGAMAQYFDKLRVNYSDKKAHEMFMRLPGGQALEGVYKRAGEIFKHTIASNHMFEQFGLCCIGPIDGHDMASLIEMLQEVKKVEAPILLHVKTVKGKGFEFTTGDPSRFHSPSPFTVEGCRVEMKKSGRSFTSAFADALNDIMEKDSKVYGITAAMPDGTGLNKILPKFPNRSLDTGICESHAMDMAAGLAKTGLKPFFAVYSTFVQRAQDQVFQEIALQGLPVRICLDRAGFVGDDGAVHHGFMDMAIFSPLPGVVMLAPSDEQNLRAGLEFMRTYDAGCSIIRYPRDNVAEIPLVKDVPAFELGKAVHVKSVKGNAASEKTDLAILAYGTEVYEAAKALDELAGQGYNVELYDARFAKPVDIALVKSLVERGVPILTVEDHSVVGGFGTMVLEACNEVGVSSDKVFRHGMPHRWVYQASRKFQLNEVGLDATGIARRVRTVLEGLAAKGAGAKIGTGASVTVKA